MSDLSYAKVNGTVYKFRDKYAKAELEKKQQTPPLGNCKNIIAIKLGSIVKITWTDPGDLQLQPGVPLARQRRTTLVRKKGGIPETKSDGVVVTVQNVVNQYKTSPYVDTLPDDDEYYYKLFPQSVNGIITNNDQNAFTPQEMDWNKIHDIVETGLASSYFSLGDVVTSHHDTYGDVEWQIVSFDHPWTFEDGQEHHSLTLLSRYTLGNAQFDAAQKQYAITNDSIFTKQHYLKYTLNSTTWYFVLQDLSATGSNRVWISKDGVYKLKYQDNKWMIINTSTSAISCYQTTVTTDPWDGTWNNNCVFQLWKKYYVYDDQYIQQIVVNHDPIPINTYYERIPDVALEASNPNRKSSGYNRWRDSGVRQWLNSQSAGGTYYIQSHIWDKPSDQMATSGFMCGFDQVGFLDNVASVTHQVAVNTTDSCGGLDTVTDRFFLPTTTQVGNGGNAGGTVFQYYTSEPQAKRVKYAYNAKTTGQYWWTAAPYFGVSNIVWYVNPAGSLGISIASNSYGSIPACVII